MLRYIEIKYQLTKIIATLSPQDPLPSRAVLCRTLDTTHATLQKAIDELVKEGALETRVGSGTFVAGQKSAPEEIRSIGVILPNNEVDSYTEMIRGLSNYTDRHNANLILCFSQGDSEKQNQHLSRLLASRVSGLIIVPAYCMDLARDYVLVNRLTQHDIPAVFCFRGIDGPTQMPTVCYNNFYGGYLATKHLIKMGYRHIAFIAQYMLRTSLDRYQGYAAAMTESGLTADRRMIVTRITEDDRPLGYTDALRMLRENPGIDAFFCHADLLMSGVYQAIRDSGRRVSDDVGVIGFDDIESYVNLTPPATSLGGKDYEIGQEAARQLWRLIRREEDGLPVYVMQPHIIERESCLGPRPRG
jgi:Transcriptional regulators